MIIRKTIFVVSLIALLVLLWWLGFLDQLTDKAWLQEKITAAGLFAPLLFVSISILLFPIFLIGPLIWISGALWPMPLAIFYSCVAGMIASMLFFFVARWLGQDWADKHIPEKIRKYETKLESHPLTTVMILRLFLWLNPAVDILIGISKVSLRHYLIASAIVLIPSTALNVVVATVGIEAISSFVGWP